MSYNDDAATYHIEFADGDVDKNVAPDHIRDPTPEEIADHSDP